jgi:hypothetical protein
MTAYKCFHIDSTAKTITETTYADYRDLQRYVRGTLTIGFAFENGDVLFVDDEALLKPQAAFFTIPGQQQPLGGNGVLTGRDSFGPDGEGEGTDDPTTTAEELAKIVTWMSVAEAAQWGRDHADVPAVSVISYEDGEVRKTVMQSYGTIFERATAPAIEPEAEV